MPTTWAETDLYLPDMIATEAIAILKNDPAASNIPILVLTGASVKDWKVKALKARAVEYLIKPISPADLIRQVRRFCRPLPFER